MITLNIDIRTAAAIRQALFSEQSDYTYDPTCVPVRITEIRNVINDLDEQIEEELKNETADS
jgi:hypothetical protein|tara:strand:+ start:50 stop:235 length:186 start_codon:yes stop_codon:yes gene_type:complete